MFWTMNCMSLRNGFAYQRCSFCPCTPVISIPNESLNSGLADSQPDTHLRISDRSISPTIFRGVIQRGRFIVSIFCEEKIQKSTPPPP